MKVFISWSGLLSQKIAELLKNWLEQCIQSIEAFYSSEDIEKGDLWNAKVTSELRDTNFGIVCLTKDNINAPWIHFEAGALSKMLDSRVATLAINIPFSDIKGPLSTFQATKIEKDDMYKLLKAINTAQDKPLTEDKLKNTFEAFWGKFENDFMEIISQETEKEDKKSTPKINVAEAVEEILQLVRSQNAMINSPTKIIPPEYFEDMMQRAIHRNDTNYIFDKLYDFTKYVLERFSEQEPEENIEVEFFKHQYLQFVEDLVSDYPVWRRRFSNLLSPKNKFRHKLTVG